MRTNIRVAGIIFHEGKLVTARQNKGEKIYDVLPGGGVEDYESVEDAIKRELREELTIDITRFRLAYIKEFNVKSKGRVIELYFYVEKYEGDIKKGLFDLKIKLSEFESVYYAELNELNNFIFYPEQLIDIIEKDKEDNFNGVKHLGLHEYPEV